MPEETSVFRHSIADSRSANQQAMLIFPMQSDAEYSFLRPEVCCSAVLHGIPHP